MKKTEIFSQKSGVIILTAQFSDVYESAIKYLPPEAKKVTFITTAANQYAEKGWVEKDREILNNNGFIVTELDIEGKTESELRTALKEAEIIFMEGGNTLFLLMEAQKNNLGAIVKEKVQTGTHYIGVSAGSIIAGPAINPDKYLERLEQLKEQPKNWNGFGLVNFYLMPHWGKEKYTQKYMASFKYQYQSFSYPSISLTDKQFVVVQEGGLQIIDEETRVVAF
jgi:dipeptidase E